MKSVTVDIRNSIVRLIVSINTQTNVFDTFCKTSKMTKHAYTHATIYSQLVYNLTEEQVIKICDSILDDSSLTKRIEGCRKKGYDIKLVLDGFTDTAIQSINNRKPKEGM